MLSISGLSVSFAQSGGAELEVLKDFDLELKEGNLLLLKAPSGTGKTTLLNAISGVLPQYIRAELSGTILLSVKSPEGLQQIDLRSVPLCDKLEYLSYQMAEQYYFFPQMEHELAFSLENLGIERGIMQSEIDRVAQYFGLDAKLMLDAAHLSGGEARLLSWAITELINPPLVLLDEPCRGVSGKNLELLAHWLESLMERGKMILCAEHLGTLDALADGVISLEKRT